MACATKFRHPWGNGMRPRSQTTERPGLCEPGHSLANPEAILSVDEGWLALSTVSRRERRQPSALPGITDIAPGVSCPTEARSPEMFKQQSSRRGLMAGILLRFLPDLKVGVSAYVCER